MTLTAGPRPPGPRRVTAAVRDRAVTGLLAAVLAVSAFVIALPQVAPAIPAASNEPTEGPSASAATGAVYREGVVGRPSSITPVTARTRADRTLVGMIFSGLVKLGPDNTLVPDLASSWTEDKSGQQWTVTIRPDATWQDGQPVTADDVVYTMSALKDPAASGVMASTWADVTVEAIDTQTVRFTLGAPVGGFLAALTQPLLPAHLLRDVPMADLATSEFATSPVGSGPYTLVQLDDAHAVLVPSSGITGPGDASGTSNGSDGAGPGDPGPSSLPESAPNGSASPTAGASVDPSAAGAVPGVNAALVRAAAASVRPSATAKPSGSASPSTTPSPSPTAVADPNAPPVTRIELSFFDTEDALASAFAAGELDGAAGMSAGTTKALASEAGASVLDYPTTMLSAVLLNLRPTRPELRDPNVRKALLGAINRKDLALSVLGGQARVADALIPPESWAYDASKVVPVAYNRSSAAKLLQKAGWTRPNGKWTAPKGKSPYKVELLTVPADVNSRLAALAMAIKADWTAFGLSVTVTEVSGSDLAERLQSGDFTAAVLDISSGLEPDLYPLLDSTQVRSNGSNRSGYQDPALDKLLEAARKPGTDAKRKAAWGALLAGLSARLPVLPLVWVDEQAVVRGLSGATPRLITNPGDRFWDVLAWRLAASP